MNRKTGGKKKAMRAARAAAAVVLALLLAAAAGCAAPSPARVDTGNGEGFSNLTGTGSDSQDATPTPAAEVPDTLPTPAATVQEAFPIEQQIVGFWQIVEVTAEGSTEDTAGEGMGIEFFSDGSLTIYDSFEQGGQSVWQATGSSELTLTNEWDEVMTFSNIQMASSGAAFRADVYVGGTLGVMSFERISQAAFFAMADPEPTEAPYDPDQELADLICREWNVMFYLEADGSESYDVFQQNIIFFADGTFDEVYDEEPAYGVWTIENGVLTCDYRGQHEGESWAYPITIDFSPELDAYKMYMEVWDYSTGLGIGEYFVFTDYQP